MHPPTLLSRGPPKPLLDERRTLKGMAHVCGWIPWDELEHELEHEPEFVQECDPSTAPALFVEAPALVMEAPALSTEAPALSTEAPVLSVQALREDSFNVSSPPVVSLPAVRNMRRDKPSSRCGVPDCSLPDFHMNR